MKWVSRRLLFWPVFLLVFGGLLAWLFWPDGRPTFRFVEFREINGERYGLFVLENGTASKIIYDGKTGTPQVHQRVYTSGAVLTDYGMHVLGGRLQGGTLEPGERVELSPGSKWARGKEKSGSLSKWRLSSPHLFGTRRGLVC